MFLDKINPYFVALMVPLSPMSPYYAPSISYTPFELQNGSMKMAMK